MTLSPTTTTAAPPIWSVPFHRVSIDDDAIEQVANVMRSGWLTTGAETRAFEEEFAAFVGSGVTALAVNSGTAALHLALEAIGVRPGSLVLTTPYTFTSTSEVIRHLGADPVYADVDPGTGNLTVAGVESVIDRLTSSERRRLVALLPVHLAGLPCDMAGLAALADAHGWSLVDDAAHALPASHAGQRIGTLGRATAFSFYATKTLCTGEGGMVTTQDPDLIARIRTMRLHGIDRDAFDRYHEKDQWYYEVVDVGFKYNLTDVAAALGRTQLRRQVEHRQRRAEIAALYSGAFGDLPVRVPADAPTGDEHAWHLYTLRILEGQEVRDAFIRALADDGIGASVHFIPLHLHPYYRRAYGLAPHDLPHALEFFRQEVSLPLFPGMTDAQVERVVTAVPAALEAARAAVRAKQWF